MEEKREDQIQTVSEPVSDQPEQKEKAKLALKLPTGKTRLIAAAVVFVLCLFITTPVVRLFSALPLVASAVKAVFGLVRMLAVLLIVRDLLQLLFDAWKPESNHAKTAFTLANSAMSYVLAIVGIMWGLAIVGVDVGALLAGAGVMALIIGFGAESLIADVITGIFMLFEHQYEVGDIITVGDFRGTVTQIGIRATRITDSGGNVKIMNNSDIRDIINRSSDNSCAVCDIAIPYQGYLRRAEAVLERELPRLYEEDCAKAEEDRLFREQPVYVGVQNMDHYSGAVVLRVAVQVSEVKIFNAQRKLNRTLLLAFEDEGIPNPVAGVKLAKD